MSIIVNNVCAQIITLLKYLLQNTTEACLERKHVMIHLTQDSENSDGYIQIDAIGSWIHQKFCIRKFKAKTWNNYKTELRVHHGDNNVRNYQLYKISNGNISLELEFEPFVMECDHYLSFVMSVKKQVLHNVHSKLKNYVKILATRNRDVKISFSVSELLWKTNDTNDKCVRMMSDAVSNVICYSAGLDFQASACALLKANGTLAASDNMYTSLYQYITCGGGGSTDVDIDI